MKVSSLKRDCFSSPIQHQYRFENCINKNAQAYNVAKNYAIHFNQMKEDNVGLLFYGDVGSGKTYLASSIANYLIEEKLMRVRIMNLSQIINQIQKSAFKFDVNEIINTLSNIPLLILDDLGIERDTSGKVIRYSEYSKQTIKRICEKKYDWSVFEKERPIMNGATGTQNAIK